MTQHLTDVKVLAFDVFGTVVDWRSSISFEGDQLGKAKGISVDWATFADSWRSIYHPFMDRVRSGQLPWTNLDGLHRQMLDETLTKFGIDTLTNDEKDNFTRVWHRLKPWPDSVPRLQRLKSRIVITTLSNGNISLLTNMAKFAGLPWDCILSAENVKRYKPDPEVYLLVPQLFDLKPNQVMMVAAHEHDLQAASKYGLKTAFVRRPLERGPGGAAEILLSDRYDVVVHDFLELAEQLGT
jgi:2-haloacid dehalogenase